MGTTIIVEIVRGLVTLGLVGACVYLWATTAGGPPPELAAMMGASVTSYLRPVLVPPKS